MPGAERAVPLFAAVPLSTEMSWPCTRPTAPGGASWALATAGVSQRRARARITKHARIGAEDVARLGAN